MTQNFLKSALKDKEIWRHKRWREHTVNKVSHSSLNTTHLAAWWEPLSLVFLKISSKHPLLDSFPEILVFLQKIERTISFSSMVYYARIYTKKHKDNVAKSREFGFESYYKKEKYIAIGFFLFSIKVLKRKLAENS